MATKDAYKDSQLVQSYLEAAKAAGMKEPANTTVGSNGYSLGQQFHSNGIEVVETEIGGRKTAYVAVTTEEGVNISLKSLMGLSSLNGYHTEGEYPNETQEGGKKVVSMVNAEVVDDFDFAQAYQPSSRQFLDFIAQAESEGLFEGKVITYLGKVVRPYEAKSDSPATSFETYKRGYKRAMAARLWSVE